ncbi:MAG TPA: lysophospholipid acyltransferase family protein, partial [Actinomycetota bacterium]|nr:lysophospholipid acyltransferase family protein [Actinomycetota bacterium]
SPLDPFALALAAVRRGRTLRFLAAAEFFERPIKGWFLRGLAQIPVRRGTGGRSALDEAVRTLAAGAAVGIFPEGRVGEGMELARGRTGVARIALRSRAPIVPVGIWGTQERWPRSGPRLGPPVRPGLAVVAAPAITPVGDPTSAADQRALIDLVMGAIGRALDQARKRAALTPPPGGSTRG